MIARRARKVDAPQAQILRAVVMGPPVAYGSKRGFYNPKLKRVMLVNSNHENLRTWQDAIRKAMIASHPGVPTDYLRPVHIRIAVYLSRPKNHYCKRGLSGNGLASNFPTRKPDCDKVARAVADCGTGIWYADDSQIVDLEINKRWADDGPERTEIELVMAIP